MGTGTACHLRWHHLIWLTQQRTWNLLKGSDSRAAKKKKKNRMARAAGLPTARDLRGGSGLQFSNSETVGTEPEPAPFSLGGGLGPRQLLRCLENASLPGEAGEPGSPRRRQTSEVLENVAPLPFATDTEDLHLPRRILHAVKLAPRSLATAQAQPTAHAQREPRWAELTKS